MSAVELIEQIKRLPADELAKVAEFVQQQTVAQNVSHAGDAEFDKAKAWAFREHDELLRKLSQ